MSDINKIARLMDEDISSSIIGPSVEIKTYWTNEGMRDADLEDVQYLLDIAMQPNMGHELIEVENNLIEQDETAEPSDFHDEDEFTHHQDSEWYLVVFTPKGALPEHVKIALVNVLRDDTV